MTDTDGGSFDPEVGVTPFGRVACVTIPLARGADPAREFDPRVADEDRAMGSMGSVDEFVDDLAGADRFQQDPHATIASCGVGE
jgi:hypothetical protein